MDSDSKSDNLQDPKGKQFKKMARPNSSGFNDDSRKKIAGIVLLVLVSAASGFGGGYLGSEARLVENSGSTTVISRENQQAAINESQLISSIAEQVSPSVVSVDVTGQSAEIPDFFGFGGGSVPQRSAGTGIIISDDGYIVTNRHVVPDGTSNVSVTLSDGTQLSDVTVVGRTNDSDPLDIAILKVKDAKGKKLQKATLGDSSKVQVGDKVIAIGNALGQFQNTVTDGIISGFGRSVTAAGSNGGSETLQNLFQTDAAINQGNSGGPLVNVNGEVIGINTAIAGGEAQNIGFAIPVNDAKGLIQSVLNKGVFERPYLGIRYVSLTDDYAYQFNLSVKRGAYIVPAAGGRSSIIAGSPADKAGLKEKDIITKIDGTEINEKNSLTSLIGRKAVGDEATLTIIRGGSEQTVKVKLEAAPAQ